MTWWDLGILPIQPSTWGFHLLNLIPSVKLGVSNIWKTLWLDFGAPSFKTNPKITLLGVIPIMAFQGIYSDNVWHIFWHSIWHLFYVLFWHSICHCFWHLFWHSIWHLFWHSIWHLSCSWGPAANTLILSLLFGSGGEHCDLALAVEVRRGTLWSWACCSGPAGNTAI